MQSRYQSSSQQKKLYGRALLDDRLDVISPLIMPPHTWEEKTGRLWTRTCRFTTGCNIQCRLMLHYVKEGKDHHRKSGGENEPCGSWMFPDQRNAGLSAKGYYADLVLVNMNQSNTVAKENILYKCGWSPAWRLSFSRIGYPYFYKWAHGLWKWWCFDESQMGNENGIWQVNKCIVKS